MELGKSDAQELRPRSPAHNFFLRMAGADSARTQISQSSGIVLNESSLKAYVQAAR